MDNNKLKLVHSDTRYRMVIPSDVERKIRLLCREISNVEWSGVLFYKVEGSFGENDLVITCVDLLQMDEGSCAYTEFTVLPDVSAYIVDHPELMENTVYQGLIHSHNQMATFFSGTDTSTLLSEGGDTNHFVSLIVNNAGVYTAGITRRVRTSTHIDEVYSYNTWGNHECAGKRASDNEGEYVEWFNLDIEVDRPDIPFEREMLDRISEIRKSKPVTQTPAWGYSRYNLNNLNSKPAQPSSKVTQPAIFSDLDECPLDYEHLPVSHEVVDSVVAQLITCSAIIPSAGKADISKWLDRMDSLYKDRFKDMDVFEGFADEFSTFIMNYTEVNGAPYELCDDEKTALLAYKVVKRLRSLPSNRWIDKWVEIISEYII